MGAAPMAQHTRGSSRPSPHGAQANTEARGPKRLGAREILGVFRYSRRAIDLVWTTSKPLTVLLAALTLIAGLLPAGAAWVGQQIVDAVVAAAAAVQAGGEPLFSFVLGWVALEGGIMVALSGAQKGLGICQSLLRAMLGHRVNVMILDKALTLQLSHFEDSEFYDKLTQARREASSRPLSLVNRTFGLIQNAISLISYAILLIAFSPWAVLVLVIGGLPAFLVEAKFSGDAFRLFRWRSPETRKQMYLESVLANDQYAKEVKLYGLGPLLLDRYREIFQLVFAEDRSLTLRRGFWSFTLGLLGTAAFYGAYAWIAVETVLGRISLGEMTMYLLVFRQGQSAVSASLSSIGGMYEDNLYLSNLYEYLEHPPAAREGTATEGPKPGDGVRFENVSFRYPGADHDALSGIDLHLRPGERLGLVGENGAGKTTLIKLLTRLYAPTEGRILLDGRDLAEWSLEALHRR
ncbi:MAG TPA: ABC transporter ATP-binding protein, partial [Enhygromyxa sp.]|nr:ABC transporter ATP-binding protein [Enhygromyxa sp.]